MKDRIIAALERAEVIGACDYLVHSWDIGTDESDFALTFSYTDCEGQIFEFEFDWDSIEKAIVFPSGFSAKDSEGEMIDINLYKLESVNI